MASSFFFKSKKIKLSYVSVYVHYALTKQIIQAKNAVYNLDVLSLVW